MVEFIETEDHSDLTAFYYKHGLEIEDGWEKEMCPIYSVRLNDNGVFCGAATVSNRYGISVLDYIAVVSDKRNCGYGRLLLENVKSELKQKGINELYLTAKKPDFFRSCGAKDTKEYSALLDECLSCLQYKKSCFPEVLVLRCI